MAKKKKTCTEHNVIIAIDKDTARCFECGKIVDIKTRR